MGFGDVLISISASMGTVADKSLWLISMGSRFS